MSETFTLYKLIILYMLNKVDFPLTTSQISEFVLDKGYTTYFKLQEAISELTQSELIRTETTHNRTLYHLTESGAETIHYFSNKISSAIRKDIDDFLTEKQYDLKEEVSVKADYYLNTDKNCDEAEKRMRLLMEDKDNLSAGDVHSIMSAISMYMIRGNVLSDGLEDVVVTLINWGYPIEKDSTGVYVMLSKREKSL